MQIKKTAKLFIFCCVTPVLISKKHKQINSFKNLGSDIGLLFQIVDDLIDYRGSSKVAGKKTKKDLKKGKATLINFLGYNDTLVYVNNLKNKIFNKLNKFGKKSESLKETINFIINREK